MTTRVPIDWADIRVGDVVEGEQYGMATRLTVRRVDGGRVYAEGAEQDPDTFMTLQGPRWFLLERPDLLPDDPGRHLPDKPTLGWAVVEGERVAGTWAVKRWRSAEDGSVLVTLLQQEIELLASDVDDFIEGELVEKSALDALALAYPPRPAALIPEPLTVVHAFLHAVLGDR